jgi:hypothetical protein
MIFYLVTKSGADTMVRFFQHWGRTMAQRMTPLPYEELLKAQTLRPGTYIFSDIERLSPNGAEFVAQVWETLDKALGKTVRLLNHPTRSMRRYELLRALYERGMNKFTVYRLTDEPHLRRYPVFLRGENDHMGPYTALIYTEAELVAAVAGLLEKGHRREDLVVVEFCDTSDEEGLFRMYTAFKIGKRIIPRSIVFSRNWVIKRGGDKKALEDHRRAWLLEMREFVEANPHTERLREIFELARIDYGRMDYGLLDGLPQVWEINTNPHIVFPTDYRADRVSIARDISSRIISAFEEIDWSPIVMTLSSLDR